MTEPRKIIAGDSVSWGRFEAGYLPADGWELEYRLVSVGQNHTIATTADGSEHRVTLVSSDTSSYAAGEYQLVPMMKRGTERVTLESKRVVIKPNPASGSYDPRSFAEKALAEIRKLLEKKATNDKQTVTVEGQTVGRYTWAELQAAETHFRGRVSQERRREREKRTGRKSNRIRVRIP